MPVGAEPIAGKIQKNLACHVKMTGQASVEI